MKLIRNTFRFVLFFIVLSLLLWLMGPESKFIRLTKKMPEVSQDLGELSTSITKEENQFTLKPNNAARIEWYGDTMAKTEYSLVYLHGFGASFMEGDPIHRMIARKYGMNLYLSRLSEHGLDQPDDQHLLHLDAEDYLESALEAIAVGHTIGEKVIVMSCSTGSTFGIYASKIDTTIAAQIMYSPNIDLFDNRSQMLTMPLGLSVAKSINGGKIRTWETGIPDVDKYWYTRQRMEALVPLRKLLNKTMTAEVFSHVEEPVYVGYWYQNDSIQDQTISVQAIREFQSEIVTPASESEFVAFSSAENHVICSPILNPQWEEVYHSTDDFCREVLGLVPVKKDTVIQKIGLIEK